MFYYDPFTLYRRWQNWLGVYIDALEEALRPWTEYRWSEPEAAESDDDSPVAVWTGVDLAAPGDAPVDVRVVFSDRGIQLVDPDGKDEDEQAPIPEAAPDVE